MRAVGGAGRGLQKVAAEFADVDEHGAAAALHVGPEVAGREPLPDHAGAAHHHDGARRQHAPVGVVHRQTIEHPVVGPGARYGREGLHGELHTVMIEVCGLGQPRRTGCVDEQALVLDRQGRALGGRQRAIRNAVEHEVEARQIAGVAIGQDLDGAVEQRTHRVELGHQGGVHDDQSGAHDVDRVGQGRAGQIRVDEGRRCARFGDAHPDRQILEPVRHQQGHDVASAEPLPQRPPGIAVGAPVPLPVSDAALLGLDRDSVAVACRELLGEVAHCVGRVLGDRCRSAKNPHDAAKEGPFARSALAKVQGPPSRPLGPTHVRFGIQGTDGPHCFGTRGARPCDGVTK